MRVKSKITVEEMLTLKEMQELMDEFCGTIPFEGPYPSLAETNYLAEETDELAESSRKKTPKKR